MSGSSELAAVGVLACGLVAAGVAAFVWSRRQGGAGRALAAILVSVSLWDLAYGAELLAPDPGWRLALGDLKYAGIGGLAASWIVFILCWTGSTSRVTRRLLLLLAVEPVGLLGLLALPATHDLVRYLPAGAADPLTVEVATGPLFWVHIVYTDLLLLPATTVFVVQLWRRSRAYRLQAFALAAATLLPWAANLLFTLSVGPFGQIDLTPVGFTLSGAVLAWGLLQQRLLRLNPLARSLLVDGMTDGVLVLDVYGHVTDANPAARAVFGEQLLGHLATEVLPAAVLAGDGAEVVLVPRSGGGERAYEVSDTPLPGARRSPAGRLLVLRDVTERSALEGRLRELLAEQAGVVQQLASSLRPPALPQAAGLALAAAFQPAGGAQDVGGDFYDVFAVGDEWAFTLGDVSGKGARAAAVTAHARYTLRTLVLAGARPAAALEQLHALVMGELDDETYLTVVHGRVRSGPDGATAVLALGGHPQPYLVHAWGRVEAVGEPGSAIGLLATAEITECEVVLAPGDALFLFSDGISEARCGPTLFGEQGLVDALVRCAGTGADALAQELLATVLRLGDGPPADDVALLVLQATPVPRPAVPPARTA